MIAHVTKTIPHLIYIDADAFVALTLDSDSNHTKAKQFEEQIFVHKPRLYTSQFALGEAITVISQKSNIATSTTFGKYILASSFTIQIARHHHMEQALKRLAKQTSKNSRFTELTRSSRRRIFEVRHR